MIDYKVLRAAFDAIVALDPAQQAQEIAAIAIRDAPLAAELQSLLDAQAEPTGGGEVFAAIQAGGLMQPMQTIGLEKR